MSRQRSRKEVWRGGLNWYHKTIDIWSAYSSSDVKKVWLDHKIR